MKISLAVEDLTLGDFDDFEEATGAGLLEILGQIESGGIPKGLPVKTIIALCWVCGRQADPGFSMDDARKLRLTDLEIDVGGDG